MKEMILQFYEKYADYAYRVALVRTNNKADAEDLSQEIVLRIIKNHDILKELISKDESQAKGYLAKAVVNMTIERYKKTSSRLKRENNFANTKMVAIDETDSDGKTDDNKHAILNAIKDLPEKYQTILMLKFYEGHSNSELSNILNIKEVSIRSLISRAIQKLKSRLVATNITLSIANITYSLETTELVSATPEFKAQIIQSIHNNYQAITLTSGYSLTFKVITALFLSIFTSLFFLKFDFLFLKESPITKKTEDKQISQTLNIKSQPAVIETQPLFKFELNMKNVTSKSELFNLVQSKLNLKSNGKFLISYEKKGISTIGKTQQVLELPYILNPDKPVVIYCESELLSKKGNTQSSAGLKLVMYEPPLGKKENLFYNDDKIYNLRFTILNKALFIESSLFEGIRPYEIDAKEFFSPILLQVNNATIKLVTIHEMTQDEIKIFQEKNAESIRLIEDFISKE
jgi:RNA polymerase sigma-70 factor (ECF subfamily)